MAFSNVLTLAGSTLTAGIRTAFPGAMDPVVTLPDTVRIKKADGEDPFLHEDGQLALGGPPLCRDGEKTRNLRSSKAYVLERLRSASARAVRELRRDSLRLSETRFVVRSPREAGHPDEARRSRGVLPER